jgi:hypothetical protein
MSTAFYPDLKIVPIADIKLQEYVQKGRMSALAQSIKEEGILRNPPIVTNFFNETYLHLDGANRITAASLLGYKNCLVQVVEYSDPTQVHLMSWSHLIHVQKDQFLSALKNLPGVELKETKSFKQSMLVRPYLVCVLVFSDGISYEVTFKGSFVDLVKRMGDVVDLYANEHVERVFSGSPWTAQSIQTRFDRYGENNLFIAFPTFSPQQVMTLVDRGVLMPAGLTRHVVYRRKLNVNLPLDYLNIMPIEKANEKLQKFLQHRSVRLYEEPIIYFE